MPKARSAVNRPRARARRRARFPTAAFGPASEATLTLNFATLRSVPPFEVPEPLIWLRFRGQLRAFCPNGT
jgi:hypothetical protein